MRFSVAISNWPFFNVAAAVLPQNETGEQRWLSSLIQESLVAGGMMRGNILLPRAHVPRTFELYRAIVFLPDAYKAEAALGGWVRRLALLQPGGKITLPIATAFLRMFLRPESYGLVCLKKPFRSCRTICFTSDPARVQWAQRCLCSRSKHSIQQTTFPALLRAINRQAAVASWIWRHHPSRANHIAQLLRVCDRVRAWLAACSSCFAFDETSVWSSCSTVQPSNESLLSVSQRMRPRWPMVYPPGFLPNDQAACSSSPNPPVYEPSLVLLDVLSVQL
ncbi:hypothetical protein VTI28DRAFT_7118 [Corynascus sepedonium]